MQEESQDPASLRLGSGFPPPPPTSTVEVVRGLFPPPLTQSARSFSGFQGCQGRGAAGTHLQGQESLCSGALVQTQTRVEGLAGPFAPRSFKAKESIAWEPLPLNVWWARQSSCEGEACCRVSLCLERARLLSKFCLHGPIRGNQRGSSYAPQPRNMAGNGVSPCGTQGKSKGMTVHLLTTPENKHPYTIQRGNTFQKYFASVTLQLCDVGKITSPCGSKKQKMIPLILKGCSEGRRLNRQQTFKTGPGE